MKLTGKKYETEMRRLQHEEQIIKEEIAELVEKRNKVRRKGVALVKKPLKILEDKLLAVKKQMEEI
jgi:hypothetical protein